MERSDAPEETGAAWDVTGRDVLAMAFGLWAGMLTSIGLGYVTLRAIAGL
ncbi:MAG: hypothetical protein KJZ54_02045 [Phycisphaerales bacterium]|nr:hypothetical protein [Phycisphaerales bacterium]